MECSMPKLSFKSNTDPTQGHIRNIGTNPTNISIQLLKKEEDNNRRKYALYRLILEREEKKQKNKMQTVILF